MAKTLEQTFEDYYNEPGAAKGQNTGVGPTGENADQQKKLKYFSNDQQQEYITANPIIGQGPGAAAVLAPAASPLAGQPDRIQVNKQNLEKIKADRAATDKAAQDAEDAKAAETVATQEALKKQHKADAKAEASYFDTRDKTFSTEQQNQIKRQQLVPPDAKPIPYKPTKPTSLIEQYGSIAMIFAMLGSMFTRNHAITALNAAAGVLNGFKEGDKEAAKQNLDEWKVANENLLKFADFQQKVYNEQLKNIDSSDALARDMLTNAGQQRLATLKANADAFKDDTSLAILKTGQAATIYDHYKSRELQNDKLYDESKKILDALEEGEADAKFKTMLGDGTWDRMSEVERQNWADTNKSPGAKDNVDKASRVKARNAEKLIALHQTPEYTKADVQTQLMLDADAGDEEAHKKLMALRVKAASKQLTPKEESAQAVMDRAIAAYQSPLAAGRASKDMAAIRADTLARVLQINPNYEERLYHQFDKVLGEYKNPSSYTGKQINTLNTASGHLLDIENMVNRQDLGDQAQMNKLWISILTMLADPDLATADVAAASPTVLDEINKMIVTNSGTEKDRELRRGLIDATGAAVINKENIKILKELLLERAQANMTQFKAGTNENEEKFAELLDKKALQLFGEDIGIPKRVIKARLGDESKSEESSKPLTAATPLPKKAKLNGQNISVVNGKWVYDETGEEVK